ncbi:MAG TPA: nitronate monooxygenase [Cyclobacteriaceae bacterium]|nr:nitronate monooxygenase [Cyclobacteriaceae bacterium]
MESKIGEMLNIKYPILQGPFGGGLSSAKLVSTVSNAGGLGGYGAYQLPPEEIKNVVQEIRTLTHQPFNINLWVNDVDESARQLTRAEFEQCAKIFKPWFDELSIPLPNQPGNVASKFERQAEILIALRPAVFSFVFGIPSKTILEDCRKQGIVTIGAATTLDEGLALEQAKVDLIVASGFEAGGHRPSFLKPAEQSLHGTFTLVRQLVKSIKTPIVAAGGIVDAVGIEAAMRLGASAVQIGTAFLACEESGASTEYRDVLFSGRNQTTLTNTFTGRLARGISGKISDNNSENERALPFPLQASFMAPLRKAAIEQKRTDLLTFWAGQNVSLIKHRSASALMNELIQPF